MIYQDPEFYVNLVLMALAILVASIIIPCYGYLRKGLKGAGLGCLIQPIIAGILITAVAVGGYNIERRKVFKNRDAALAVVRTDSVIADDTLSYTWYLKPDGECMCEIRGVDEIISDYHEIQLYDIVTLNPTGKRGGSGGAEGSEADASDTVLASDTLSLCVEDHIVVNFDLKSHTATATDFGKPSDIVSINWQNIERLKKKD